MYARISVEKQRERVAALEKEVAELQGALGENEDANKIVQDHIKLLHRYNEAKDATQILIGRLAAMKGSTVRQIHKDLELPEQD
ncbi:hypothetical protein K435DRAFT_344576 [Dendrothele bispora CBS 962.96]|uniref:Swi5-domain-containing protein n=1 Tax=Dendrothele bispora (strain CBS 962.96) TaxID=1314807 RepID=A0A4V4HHF6_DENBC|nr:hypothetical protein K435DRAFT_344576 [Dendrothele bispora CBS 962.96]